MYKCVSNSEFSDVSTGRGGVIQRQMVQGIWIRTSIIQAVFMTPYSDTRYSVRIEPRHG